MANSRGQQLQFLIAINSDRKIGDPKQSRAITKLTQIFSDQANPVFLLRGCIEAQLTVRVKEGH
jgi:hypothetical protein